MLIVFIGKKLKTRKQIKDVSMKITFLFISVPFPYYGPMRSITRKLKFLYFIPTHSYHLRIY